MTDLFFYKFAEVLPSGQENEERHVEKEGEIENWSGMGRKTKSEEGDADNNDEEEDKEDKEEEDIEEEMGGGASVVTDLCVWSVLPGHTMPA